MGVVKSPFACAPLPPSTTTSKGSIGGFVFKICVVRRGQRHHAEP